MLNSFEISGFRSFAHLRVEKLARVNLIVGRNNVGKTMFLEALRLYALGGSPASLRNLLLERDEILTDTYSAEDDDPEVWLRVGSLFHRSKNTNGGPPRIRIGTIDDSSRALSIRAMVAARVRGESGNGDFYQEYKGPLPFPGDGTVMAGLQIAKGKPTLTIPANSLSNGKFYQHASDTPAWPPYVHARGVSDRDLSRWWDSVALSDAESRVLQSLKIIAEIERINLIENPTRRKERIVMAKIAGESQPVPLKSLGDGMMRLFQIALAIECTRSNEPVQHPVFDIQHLFDNIARSAGIAMLLVDEIESGIHYRAMPDFWRFILRVAKLHDVQVFATSHSWDCIQALQEAASDTADADVMLIRLEKKEYATKAVLFDQRELAIVTRDNIEVR